MFLALSLNVRKTWTLSDILPSGEQELEPQSEGLFKAMLLVSGRAMRRGLHGLQTQALRTP